MPIVVEPSLNVRLPVALLGVTIPVSVTLAPYVEGFVPDVTAVVVAQEIPVRPTVTILADLDNAADAERVRSVSHAHHLLKAFDAAAMRR